MAKVVCQETMDPKVALEAMVDLEVVMVPDGDKEEMVDGLIASLLVEKVETEVLKEIMDLRDKVELAQEVTAGNVVYLETLDKMD